MTSEAEIRSSDSSHDELVENGSNTQKRLAKVPTNVMVQDYDKYRKHLKESGLLAFKGEGTTALLENLHELQGLYDNYHKTSSMTVHFSDAQALNDTSNYAAVNAKNLKLGDMGTSLTSKEFTDQLSKFLFNSQLGDGAISEEPDLMTEERFNKFDWLKMGLVFYNTSLKPIPMEFLNGPLETEKKVRNRRKVIDDTKGGRTTTAEQIDLDSLDADELNTAHLVREVFRTVVQKQSDDTPVNFFKFFIDPNSFSQSVENLFFTSFLIRDARLKLTVVDGIPMVSKINDEETRKIMKADKLKINSSHHIASFDYDTWEEVIRKYNITESYLGHRDIEGEEHEEGADDTSESEEEEESDYTSFQNEDQPDISQNGFQVSEKDSDSEEDSEEEGDSDGEPPRVKRRKLNL